MSYKVTQQTWPTWSKLVAAPASPTDYVEAAIERLTSKLDIHIKRVVGVRSQFNAKNTVKFIRFKTQEERQYYLDTEKRYLEKKDKLDAAMEAGLESNGIWQLVLLNEKIAAAEYCRREHLAEHMFQSVQMGKAGVCAVKYKRTLIAVVKLLIEKYGVQRDNISLIWGGGQTKISKKQVNKEAIQQKRLALEAMGISVDELMEDMDMTNMEDRQIEEFPPEWRLGMQSIPERQKEIDRFQVGKSLYCIYTFRAGGVGLSLPHSDEMTKEKCRRKESGYVYEEDIPLIPTRPRRNILAPTYSGIDMQQGLGRCPRIISLSDTEQEICLYEGTVEVEVGMILRQKLRCIGAVNRLKEDWYDMLTGKGSVKQHLELTENAKDDSLDDLSTDDEDEE